MDTSQLAIARSGVEVGVYLGSVCMVSSSSLTDCLSSSEVSAPGDPYCSDLSRNESLYKTDVKSHPFSSRFILLCGPAVHVWNLEAAFKRYSLVIDPRCR